MTNKYSILQKASFSLIPLGIIAYGLLTATASCDKNDSDNCDSIPISDTINSNYAYPVTFSSGEPYSPPGSIYRFYGATVPFLHNKFPSERALAPIDDALIDFRMRNGWSNWGNREALSAAKYLAYQNGEDKCFGFIQIDSTDALTPPAALHLVLDSLRDFSPSANETQKFKTWQVAKILDADSQDVSQAASWACFADNRYSFFKGGKCEIQTGALACDQEAPNTSLFTNYQITSEFSSHQNPGRLHLETYVIGEEKPVSFEVLQSNFQQVRLALQNELGEKAVLYLKRAADPTPRQPKVGDYRGGGVVFYVAPSPTDLNGDGIPDRGLVCALNDQSSGSDWGCSGTDLNGNNNSSAPELTGIGDGQANTNSILKTCNDPTSAARICANFSLTVLGLTYDDWFLPSKDELNLMYQNKALIDSTAIANGGSPFDKSGSNISSSANYWSSSEYNGTKAWRQNFLSGYQNFNFKTYPTYSVRAVRAF